MITKSTAWIIEYKTSSTRLRRRVGTYKDTAGSWQRSVMNHAIVGKGATLVGILKEWSRHVYLQRNNDDFHYMTYRLRNLSNSEVQWILPTQP